MRMLSRTLASNVVLISLLALPRAAAADPVVVTSGRLETQPGTGLVQLRFLGEDFVLQAGGDGFISSLGTDCIPCAPGATVDLGGAFNIPILSGAAVVDGVSYPTIFVDGMTGTFVTPSVRVEGSSTTTITAPFTYSGTVSGFLEHPLTRGANVPPVFTKSLIGSGQATATLVLSLGEDPVFTATEHRYDFEEAEPVPEPATMVLFGAGAAALAARRRRRPS